MKSHHSNLCMRQMWPGPTSWWIFEILSLSCCFPLDNKDVSFSHLKFDLRLNKILKETKWKLSLDFETLVATVCDWLKSWIFSLRLFCISSSMTVKWILCQVISSYCRVNDILMPRNFYGRAFQICILWNYKCPIPAAENLIKNLNKAYFIHNILSN